MNDKTELERRLIEKVDEVRRVRRMIGPGLDGDVLEQHRVAMCELTDVAGYLADAIREQGRVDDQDRAWVE